MGSPPTKAEVSAAAEIILGEAFMLAICIANIPTPAAQQDPHLRAVFVGGAIKHIRNLSWFLYGDGRKDDIVAAQFMPPGHEWEAEEPPVVGDVVLRASKQSQHMTYAAVRDPERRKNVPIEEAGVAVFKTLCRFVREADKDLLGEYAEQIYLTGIAIAGEYEGEFALGTPAP